MSNWSTGLPAQQGSASSLLASQIRIQLSQLYVKLQGYDPAWCQENTFLSLTNGRTEAELCDLAVIWSQCIDSFQAQRYEAAPTASDAMGQHHYFEQGLGTNLATQQSFEPFAYGGLNPTAQPFFVPGIQNKEQGAAPQQPDVRMNHGPMGHDQPIAAPPQQPFLPPTPAPVEADPDNATTTLPAWLSLVRPQPEGQAIIIRRECQVVLGIKFKELSAFLGQRPVTQRSLVIPSTANVRTENDCGEGDVLHFSVRVFGADTKSEYKAVCNVCSKREGKKKGNPSLVDFHAPSNVIKASDDGLAKVGFKFSCYPKHQNPNESAYMLEVTLVENQSQGQMVPSQRVVATCRLPWHFTVGKRRGGQPAPAASAGGAVPHQDEAGSPSVQPPMILDTPTPRLCPRAELGVPIVEPSILSSPGSSSLSEGEHQGVSFVPSSNTQAPAARGPGAKGVAGSTQRKRGRTEAGLDGVDSHGTTGGRHVRPRLDRWDDHPSTGPAGPSAPPAGHSRSHPIPTAERPGVTQGTTPHGDSSLNGSPATSATPTVSQPNPAPRPVQGHPNPAQSAELINTVLRGANPRRGPVSGGIEIWLEAQDLPTTFTLYARFGNRVTATTVKNALILSCVLPSASHSGRVKVTLSRSAYCEAPEFGTSVAEFVYDQDHAPLIPLLLRMEEKGRPEYTPTIQALLRMIQGDHAPQDSDNSEAEQIEASILKALLSLSEKPNFDDIVSTSNDYSQTLAHLSVLYGYISLLSRLVEWRIDLTVADISGLTALHCAYLKEDRESIRILLSGGAPPSIEDKLGRRPIDLLPEGSDLVDLPEGVIGIREGTPPFEHPMDHEIALGEQFTVLEAEEDHGNDSGHGGSDPGSDVSSNNDEDEEGIDIDSPNLEPGPSTSKVSTLDVMNQLLISKKSRKKSGPRLIPDTPHDAAISTVAKKLQDDEAESSAVEFLCNGVFPDGTITLEALRAPMTTEESTKFHLEEGAEKYRGLLSREREVFNCRLCPEDNKLDFKDPEEALHHMTKDHFDMGYSCFCGCDQTYWTSRDLKKHQKGIDTEHVQATAT